MVEVFLEAKDVWESELPAAHPSCAWIHTQDGTWMGEPAQPGTMLDRVELSYHHARNMPVLLMPAPTKAYSTLRDLCMYSAVASGAP